MSLLSAAPLAAQTGAEGHRQAILRYLEQVRNETGAPGISAAVGLAGEIVFTGGVGCAELDNLTPADGGTVWNVGSVSKVLTGVAVMQLVERGSVSLPDRIQKYVPSYPEKRAPIVCQDCRSEFLLCFSCKARNLCPSCDAKRAAAFAAFLQEELLEDVGQTALPCATSLRGLRQQAPRMESVRLFR